MRVLALVTLPTLGAGNRLRIEQYAPGLRDHGIELEVSPFFDHDTYVHLYRQGSVMRKAAGTVGGVVTRARDMARARGYDAVLVYRESAPVGPPLIERFLVAVGLPYVFDFDDAIFLRPIHPANRRWAWLRSASRVRWTVTHAAAVIAGNDYLADWARRWNGDVTVIPTPVDTERHRPKADRHGRTQDVILGWVGSSTTAPYLRLLDRPLAQLAREVPVRLRVIGGTYSHPVVPVESIDYDLAAEPDQVAEFDIGLLPEPDDAWTRGKGAFKALLYMAAGVPVVASDVGVNAEVVGGGGVCVSGDSEWAETLATMARDTRLRRELGDLGRERVIQHYSLAQAVPRLAAVLRAAVDRRRA